MKARAGLTLIETMVAGAIAALVLTAAFEGIVVVTKVAHENAQVMSAEAYAWETAWRALNRAYEDLASETRLVTDAECPPLGRASAGASARLNVTVDAPAVVTRHGRSVSARRIAVDVAWGPTGRRRSLNGVAEAGSASCGIPIVVWKTEIERTQ